MGERRREALYTTDASEKTGAVALADIWVAAVAQAGV